MWMVLTPYPQSLLASPGQAQTCLSLPQSQPAAHQFKHKVPKAIRYHRGLTLPSRLHLKNQIKFFPLYVLTAFHLYVAIRAHRALSTINYPLHTYCHSGFTLTEAHLNMFK